MSCSAGHAFLTRLIRSRLSLLFIPLFEMQGGVGFARNIIFKNVKMHNVTNPIIIHQHYCDTAKKECPTPVEVT